MKLRSLLRRRSLHNFSAVWQAQNWVRRRFTRSGQFLIMSALLTATFGINTRMALAYQLFSFITACLLLAWIWTFTWWQKLPSGLKITRSLPVHASVGAQARYHLQIHNQSQQDLAGYSVLEAPHDPRPSREQFAHAIEPGAETRNWFDRVVGYYRWAWLLHMNRITDIDELPLPRIARGKSLQIQHSFTPFARGNLVLRGIWLTRTDPLGLCRSLHFIELPASLVVLPAMNEVQLPEMPSARHAQEQMAASSSGDGEEFVGLRQYRSGDSPRMIHWKSMARLGYPVVKEYQAEFSTRHALLLDTVQAPAGVAFEEAIVLTASLINHLHTNDSMLDMFYIDNACHVMTCGQGQLQPEALLRCLAQLQACKLPLLDDLHALLLSQSAQLSACVCIFLRWDAARAALVAQLRKQGLPLQLWLISNQIDNDVPEDVQILPVGTISAQSAAQAATQAAAQSAPRQSAPPPSGEIR